MLLTSIIVGFVIQTFLTDKVLSLQKRADLSTLDAFKNVPDEVRFSAQINTLPDGAYAAQRSGSATNGHQCNKVTAVPRHLRFITRYNFYRKYTHAYGIPVISSYQASDKSLMRACNIIRFLFADRYDVRNSMYKNFGRFAVIAIREHTTTIPEFSHLPNWWNKRARGLGGVLGRPMSCGGEENVLCLPQDRYRGDDIFFHESAHNVAEVALAGGAIPGMYRRIGYAYSAALRAGKLNRVYGRTDQREYWAEGMQSFFNNHPDANPPDGTHNHVNTRAELRTYDNRLFNLIREVYPCMNYYTQCNNGFLKKPMKMNCDKKGGGTTTTTTTTKPVVTKDPVPTECTWKEKKKDKNCVDTRNQCGRWANRGECQKNPWMKTGCCKSCSSKGGNCKDLSQNCVGWANGGFCKTSRRYMSKNCRKSCKLCKDTGKSGKVKVCKVVTTKKPVVTTKKTTKEPVVTVDPKITQKPPPQPDECTTSVAAGMESKAILDSSITASTSESKWHLPSQGRLNLKESSNGVGAWCAGIQNNKQYLEIDLGAPKTIKEISIQGRESTYPKYVKRFRISLKNDGDKGWRFIADAVDYNTPRIFAGNKDMKTVKKVKMDDPFVARYVRVTAVEWKNMICMRLEIHHC